MTDLHSLTEHLGNIAKEAGAFIRGPSAHEVKVKGKTNKKDFVTSADIRSQDMICSRLQQIFPHIQVVSEEHDESQRASLFKTDFTGFVIDPIDGTYNFKRDMRESAVSIGYIEKGAPRAGVIYDPYKNELFSVKKGYGARRNGVKIAVSQQTDLSGASITTSNSYDDAAMARNLKRHLAIYDRTGVMPWTSCTGSGVLIMAGIACGRFDAYHHNGLKPWDNAAAFLLVKEAGSTVERIDGGISRFTDTTVLMGTPGVTSILRDIFTNIEPALLT